MKHKPEVKLEWLIELNCLECGHGLECEAIISTVNKLMKISAEPCPNCCKEKEGE